MRTNSLQLVLTHKALSFNRLSTYEQTTPGEAKFMKKIFKHCRKMIILEGDRQVSNLEIGF